jgi:hypothetical protein
VLPQTPSLTLLQQDLAFILTNHQSLVAANAMRNPTPDEERYVSTALALWYTLLEHCKAITVLLREDLVGSANVVHRSAYETAIHLVYLVTVGNKYENARLHDTRMLLEFIAAAPPAFTVETTNRLAAVPTVIQDRVRRDKYSRKKRGLQWSGKTLAEMAAAIKIRQHEGFFSLRSWDTHGLSAGDDLRREERPEGVTFWRHNIDAEDVEAVARHARRTVLRPAYNLATRDFYGAAPPLPTPSPPNGY